jgi:hypothetical protein
MALNPYVKFKSAFHSSSSCLTFLTDRSEVEMAYVPELTTGNDINTNVGFNFSNSSLVEDGPDRLTVADTRHFEVNSSFFS